MSLCLKNEAAGCCPTWIHTAHNIDGGRDADNGDDMSNYISPDRDLAAPSPSFRFRFAADSFSKHA